MLKLVGSSEVGAVEDKLEFGPRNWKVTMLTTEGVREVIEHWSEIAGWSYSRTCHQLIVEGIRSYDWPFRRGVLEDEE
jgi:hypothetical protein